MLPLLAALIAATQPPPQARPAALGHTAWVLATVGHSEWCPAGNVRLDLRTGRYALTPRASRRICGTAGLERPVVTGRLEPARLAPIRAAYLRARAEGLVHPDCENGRGPGDRIVISNGGRQLLVVAHGAATIWPPEDLGCWSDAANALHARLDEAFRSAQRR